MELLQFYCTVRALETKLTSILYTLKEADPTHSINERYRDISTAICLKWFAGVRTIPSSRNSGIGTL
jgi:hypothetical protein